MRAVSRSFLRGKRSAWWRERNAEWMLQLRTLRANGDWDKYWTEVAKN
jgi:hypothetical protein